MAEGKKHFPWYWKNLACFFSFSWKQIDRELKTKLNAKKLYETDLVKHLEIQIDNNLTWKQKINHVAIKPNKDNAMLSKLRHVLDVKTRLRPALLFGHKALVQLKDVISYGKSPQNYVLSKSKFSFIGRLQNS